MQDFPKIFQEYFSEIRKRHLQGGYTEMTFRTPFANFISKLNSDYDLFEEPERQRKFGAPDYKAYKKSVKIGYIETKDLPVDLDKEIRSEQLERYKESTNNIIFTNYHRFILIRNTNKIFDFNLFKINDLEESKFKISTEKQKQFMKILESYFDYNIATIASEEELAEELAKRAKLLKEVAIEQLEYDQKTKGDQLPSVIFYFYQGIKQLINDITIEKCADAYAQTITYGLFLSKLKIKNKTLTRETAALNIPQSIMIIKKIFRNITEGITSDISWIIDEIIDILNACDFEKIVSKIDSRMMADKDPFSFFYEDFLEKYDPEMRKSLGIYYTPRPVVFFIVNSINLILKNDFNKLNAYAEDDVTVLDPATGTGTFLWLIYLQAILELKSKNLGGLLKNKIQKHILKDFYGFEIMIASYIFAHLKLAATLDQQGYKLTDNDRAQIYLTNTLEPSIHEGLLAFMKEIDEENRIANILKTEKNVLVIVSNPPYKSISSNKSKWIQDLLKKGYKTSGGYEDEGYYKIDGQPLGEKNPKNLQDDYVKFIRFAQWKIDNAGEGIVGYITNNKYLENPTFRGMRRSLLRSFDRIYILNLHGDVTKTKSSQTNKKDENVFEDIKQGVAISIFIKSKKFKEKKIFYADRWGKRREKFAWLDKHNACYSSLDRLKGTDVDWVEIKPISPYYFFLEPKDLSLLKQYEKFWKITDIFRFKGVGIVTARDKLTIKWTPDEVLDTITRFANIEPDEAKKEFQLKDSAKWVESAQKDLKESGLDKAKIVPIHYRPFDIRYTYYTGKSGAFHDRPRPETMQHMVHENLGIITRRQMLPPFNYVFVSDTIISDSVIRTVDGKGVESLFPLYLYRDSSGKTKEPNIKSELFKHLSNLYGKKISPEDIFNYIYAVLYSNLYRQTYSEFLEYDFPRVPFVQKFDLFKKLSNLGNKLILLHTEKKKLSTKTHFDIGGSNIVTSPKYSDNKVYINEKQYFQGISKQIWKFSIGSYPVLLKWLKSRKERELTTNDIEQFLQIVEIIKETISIMQKIDSIKFLPK